MKVIFHEKFNEVYDRDPAAREGRLECIVDELEDSYQFVKPLPARQSDLLLIHGQGQLDHVRSQGEHLYEIAALSAGGAIKAAELAANGEPAFALIRPPGHHASRDFCWGYCWFNNVAIAVEKLRSEKLVSKVLIVDIDLHLGDGTRNIFAQVPEVVYYHLDSLEGLAQCLKNNRDCDLVALSAGFDRHIEDWGKTLKTEDFAEIGKMIASYACDFCGGRYFAVLEGGYNQHVLGDNVKAMLHGLDRKNHQLN
jgi:acetoin utilization deacetylase AcuC-like enzyme